MSNDAHEFAANDHGGGGGAGPTSTAVAPGKATRTGRLTAGKAAASWGGELGVPSVASSDDDPFALHLIGTPIQRQETMAAATGGAGTADPDRAFTAATRGAAGEVPYRAEMQARFGADFGGVQAFVGRDLGALAAHAATRGDTVAFASSSPDQEIVAHELTHVMQSRQGRVGGAAMSDPGDASEHEARGVAADVAAGRPIAVGGAAPSAAIHRQEIRPAYPTTEGLGGALDWSGGANMDLSALPIGSGPDAPLGRVPESVREIYDYYLLRHLQALLPAMCSGIPIPSEEVSTDQAAALRATAARSIVARAVRTMASAPDAEAIRIPLFTAHQHAIVDALRVSTSWRYDQKTNKETGELETFCNVYAYDAVIAMGAYIPRVWWTDAAEAKIKKKVRVISPTEAATRTDYDEFVSEGSTVQLRANDLYDWMGTYGESYGWRVIDTPAEAQGEANRGVIVVILGSTGTTASAGHISVVLAETAQRQRPPQAEGAPFVPLQSQAGRDNFAANNLPLDPAEQPEAELSDGFIAWWEASTLYAGGAGFWGYYGPPRAGAIEPATLETVTAS